MNLPSASSFLDLTRQWADIAGPLAASAGWQALLWGALGALLGLMVGLLLLWQVGRRGLLRRQPRLWHLGLKLVYPLILGATLFTGLAGGALYGVQREVRTALRETLEPVLVRGMPALRAQLGTHLGPVASDGMVSLRELVQPLARDFHYVPRGDSTGERLKTCLINGFVDRVAAAAFEQALQQALTRLPELLGVAREGAQGELLEFSAATLGKVLAGTADNIDFSQLDRSVPALFTAAVSKQIDGLFKGFYTGLLLPLLALAALIGAEVLFYFRYWLPRREAAPAGAV